MRVYQQLKTEEEKKIFLRKEMSQHNKQLAIAAKGAGVIEPVDYMLSSKTMATWVCMEAWMLKEFTQEKH